MSTPHLSPDTLSDLVEGLLATGPEAEAEQHLASCVQCRELRDGLAGVRTLLGDLPDVPMPASVGERVDAALRAAQSSPSDAKAGATKPPGVQKTPKPKKAAKRPAATAEKKPTEAKKPAETDKPAKLAAAADGKAKKPTGTDKPAQSEKPAAPAEPGKAAEAARNGGTPLLPLRPRRPTRSEVTWLGGAAAACLALVFGGIVLLGDGSSDGPESAAGQAASRAGEGSVLSEIAVTASGRSYDPASLPGAVDQLVASAARAGSGSDSGTEGEAAPKARPQTEPDQRVTSTPGSEDAPAAAPPPLSRPEALRSCLAALDPPGAEPLAVDLGTFEGAPAAVVVLPSARTPGDVEVYVVRPGCSEENPGLRYHTRVPHP
ncbi:MAG: anti-sigma factor family protein [Actinomycetes bacterium]